MSEIRQPLLHVENLKQHFRISRRSVTKAVDGISFDIYSRTTSDIHHKFASDYFRRLYDNGKFIEQTSEQFYDPETGEYLNDETMQVIEDVRSGKEPVYHFDSFEDFKSWCEAL